MHKMEELREMLCEELEEITKKGELSAGSLDVVDKLTHSIKSIDTIMAMEEAGYSNDGGYSGARGRGRNARRDSMGRYSREGGSYGNSMEGGGSNDGGSYGGGSYGGGSSRNSYGGSYARGGGRSSRGYSRADEMENLKEQLYEMEGMMQDEKSRRMVEKWIKQVEEA